RVALGIDRDSWKARAEALEARQVKLGAVVKKRANDCRVCNGEGYLDVLKPISGRVVKKRVACSHCADLCYALAELGDGDG
ncbi:hypothetical protein LCGC14_2754930, partial [marine sediment metagenome]